MIKKDKTALAPEEKRDALKQLILSLTDEQANWIIEVLKCSLAEEN